MSRPPAEPYLRPLVGGGDGGRPARLRRRAAGIPHASVCDGRGRCFTCRVHVSRGFDALPPPEEGERALEAGRAMAAALGGLNAALGEEPSGPLRIGVGLHAGSVIVGEMGYSRAASATANPLRLVKILGRERPLRIYPLADGGDIPPQA